MTPRSTVPFRAVPTASDTLGLPERDVRRAVDDAVRRAWVEATRRVRRVLVLLTIDTIAGVAGIVTLYATWSWVSADGLRPVPDEVPLLAMVFCLQPLALKVTGAYGTGRARADVFRIAAGVGIAAFLGWVQARLFGRADPDVPNRAAYLYSAALVTMYVCIGRLALNRLVALGYRAGVLQRRVLVVASMEEADDLSRRCAEAGADFRIVGRIAPSMGNGAPPDLHAAVPRATPLVGGLETLPAALASSRVQGVVIVSMLPLPTLHAVVRECFLAGAVVLLLPQVLDKLSGAQIDVHQSPVGSFLQLYPVRLELPQMAVKRLMDVVLAVAGLLVIWPLFVLIAVAIKLESEGPVLFAQERVGVGGRPFRMLKFRTMRAGADAMKAQLAHLNQSGDTRLFKIPNDPRVTRVGRLLRRSSLDELPQILNVLRGEMSLVGPRPFFHSDLIAYQRHHFERLHVLPGITGLWQVSGRSDVLDFEEVVRLDAEYIRNWSVAADIGILLRTVPAAFRRGAY